MVNIRHAWIATVASLLVSLIAGASSTRQKRQVVGLSDAVNLANTNQAYYSDVNGLMRMMDSLGHGNGQRVDTLLSDGNSRNPDVRIITEMLSFEDLLGSSNGRQQLSQLSNQVEKAMQSLTQGIQMSQGLKQAEDITSIFNNGGIGKILNEVGRLLAGGNSKHMLPSSVESQVLQNINQFMLTIKHLPTLNGMLEQFSQFIKYLRVRNPSAAKHLDQAFANAAMTLHSMDNDMSMPGLQNMIKMLQMGFGNLNSSIEMVENAANTLQSMIAGPQLLQALKDGNCLVKGLTGDVNTATASGCTHHLLQIVSMGNDSENTVISFNNFLVNFIGSPQLMQSFERFSKFPGLDNAFDMFKKTMMHLSKGNSDYAENMQSVQNLLENVLSNPQLLQTLRGLLQHPQSSAVYETAMQFLGDSSMGDSATQQVLRLVEDTIVRMQRDADAQQVIGKLEEILSVLINSQDSTQPLTDAQKALVRLVRKMLDMARPFGSTNAPIATPIVTTADPGHATVTIHQTAQSQATTAQPTTTGDAENVPAPTQVAPRPTTRETATGDNGATCFSSPVLPLIITVFVSAMLI